MWTVNDCIFGVDTDGLMHYTTTKNMNIMDGTWKVVRVTLKDDEFIEGPMKVVDDEKRRLWSEPWTLLFWKYDHRCQLSNMAVGCPCVSNKGYFIRGCYIIKCQASSSSCVKHNRNDKNNIFRPQGNYTYFRIQVLWSSNRWIRKFLVEWL